MYLFFPVQSSLLSGLLTEISNSFDHLLSVCVLAHGPVLIPACYLAMCPGLLGLLSIQQKANGQSTALPAEMICSAVWITKFKHGGISQGKSI